MSHTSLITHLDTITQTLAAESAITNQLIGRLKADQDTLLVLGHDGQAERLNDAIVQFKYYMRVTEVLVASYKNIVQLTR